ncbi:MAG: hypothetical protein AAGC60_04570 [Acidobacteriota bacterium]
MVVYQPGEHQPQALGPGNNFQILLNAIAFAAREGDLLWLFGDGFERGDLSAWSAMP